MMIRVRPGLNGKRSLERILRLSCLLSLLRLSLFLDVLNCLRLKALNKEVSGRGSSTDIVEASAKAYIDAINRMVSAEGEDEAETKVEL